MATTYPLQKTSELAVQQQFRQFSCLVLSINITCIHRKHYMVTVGLISPFLGALQIFNQQKVLKRACQLLQNSIYYLKNAAFQSDSANILVLHRKPEFCIVHSVSFLNSILI